MAKKTITETKVLVSEGVVWGESPRWHDGVLYFSDIMGKKLMKTDLAGNAEIIVEVPAMPSGTGFLPDGRELTVSGGDGMLYTVEDGKLVPYANIYESLPGTKGINDMVVAEDGAAYVGCYGFDITSYRGGPAPGWVALVTPDKKVVKAGDGISCPNGMVITPDGKTLIAADTMKRRLVSWDIAEDGTLANYRIFANMSGGPDGIGLDAEGAIWAAVPDQMEVQRVLKGGEVTHVVKPGNKPLACMLGGADRKTLFMVTVTAQSEAETSDLSAMAQKKCHIEYVEGIEVSGAGRP